MPRKNKKVKRVNPINHIPNYEIRLPRLPRIFTINNGSEAPYYANLIIQPESNANLVQFYTNNRTQQNNHTEEDPQDTNN